MSSYKKYHFAHLVCELPGQEPEEQVVYHPDFLRFHTHLVERAKETGKRFRTICDDNFQRACFPALLDNLDHGEQSIVEELIRSGRREDEVIWHVINYRMYRQIQAIARGSGTAQGINAWVELFNAFMKCGTAALQGKTALRIYFADAEVFVPYFLQYLTGIMTSEKQDIEPLREETDRIFLFIKARRKGTPLDDASFHDFLKWVDAYRNSMEREFKE